VVVYDGGRVVQAAPKADLLSRPASETVARLIGLRNIVRGTVVKAAADRIEIAWRGHVVESVNAPTHPYLAPPGTPVAFVVRPEHVRLIRKDRSAPDSAHHANVLTGSVVGELDQGTTWTLLFRLDTPGAPSQGDHDLEIEVPKLVYEMLEIRHDRHWAVSMHRGALQVLPS
jgi:ABC-type Fe3+/spermidine/putrescine transport system ATPase subunit